MKDRQFQGFFLAYILLSATSIGLAETGREASRGELLYSTHCIACHSTHVHWRDKREVSDWRSLVNQVRRWQGNTGLGWGEEDIAAVAAYLNATFYHLQPADTKRVASTATED